MRQRFRRFVRGVKRVGRWFICDWWVVRRGTFPYPKGGYCIYNLYKNKTIETGRLKIDAQKRCDDLNYWGY